MSEPIPMLILCPRCFTQHVDEGEFATRPHKTHTCQSCGLNFQPALVPTVGVKFLPGCKTPSSTAPPVPPTLFRGENMVNTSTMHALRLDDDAQNLWVALCTDKPADGWFTTTNSSLSSVDMINCSLCRRLNESVDVLDLSVRSLQHPGAGGHPQDLAAHAPERGQPPQAQPGQRPNDEGNRGGAGEARPEAGRVSALPPHQYTAPPPPKCPQCAFTLVPGEIEETTAAVKSKFRSKTQHAQKLHRVLRCPSCRRARAVEPATPTGGQR